MISVGYYSWVSRTGMYCARKAVAWSSGSRPLSRAEHHGGGGIVRGGILIVRWGFAFCVGGLLLFVWVVFDVELFDGVTVFLEASLVLDGVTLFLEASFVLDGVTVFLDVLSKLEGVTVFLDDVTVFLDGFMALFDGVTVFCSLLSVTLLFCDSDVEG